MLGSEAPDAKSRPVSMMCRTFTSYLHPAMCLVPILAQCVRASRASWHVFPCAPCLRSARNWRSVAKRLGDALAATSHTPWRTLALDLRQASRASLGSCRWMFSTRAPPCRAHGSAPHCANKQGARGIHAGCMALTSAPVRAGATAAARASARSHRLTAWRQQRATLQTSSLTSWGERAWSHVKLARGGWQSLVSLPAQVHLTGYLTRSRDHKAAWLPVMISSAWWRASGCRGRAPVGILGHSMGGKVLLSLLQQLGRPDAGELAVHATGSDHGDREAAMTVRVSRWSCNAC